MARTPKGPPPPESALEFALAYASRGWHVLPCLPNEKKPLSAAVPHGLRDATTDPDVITKWFTEHPNANVAISCGPSKIVVVDLDVHEGKDGPGQWREWCKENDVSANDTLTARTPSGGIHLVYSGTCSSSTSRIAKGIDTRGDGGYALVAPSRIGTAEYKWQDLIEPLPLPEQVRDAVNGKRKVIETTAVTVATPLPGSSTLIELMQQDRIPLVRKGALNEWCSPCPFCVPGQLTGDDRFIVHPDGGRDGLGRYWCRKCDVKGDSAEWLIRKRKANIVDAKLARGIAVDEKYLPKSPIALLEEKIDAQTAETADNPWAKYRTPAALYARELPPPIDWLVYGVVEATTIGLTVGKPGDLKSMLIADMCVCLAAGKPWLGGHPVENPKIPSLQTRKIRVAWIDVDMGRHRTHRRLHALTSAHGTDGEGLDVYSFPPLDIADPSSFDDLIKLVKYGGYGMLVLDTLINSMPSIVSENDNASLARSMTMLRRVSDQTRISVMGIHHPNKAARDAKDSNSTRGGSAIIGAVDNSLFVERDRSGDKDHLRIVSSKERGDAIDDVYVKWYLKRDARGEMIWARFHAIPKFAFGATASGKSMEDEIIGTLMAANAPMTSPKLYAAVGGNRGAFLEAMKLLLQRQRVQIIQNKATKFKKMFYVKQEKFS